MECCGHVVFLKLEESHELPIVDITQVFDLPQNLPPDKYNNSLHLSLNDTFFFFNEDNTILSYDGTIAVFLLSNICSSHIISIIIEDVLQATIYRNGKRVETKIHNFSYNGSIHVLSCNETQYLIIGGTNYESPDSLNESEALDQGYINPMIELVISFQLGNAKGHKFCEKIMIRYTFLSHLSNLKYPCILEKEIISIEEEN